jgi:hypothetical protein
MKNARLGGFSRSLLPGWYAATRAKVEAKAALQQAEELRRVLEELGERFGEGL